MALEDIFNALEEQAKVDCDEILNGARQQAESIARDCEAECEALTNRHVEQREREVRAQLAQGLNAARLEAKKLVAGVKEEAVGRSFDSANKALAGVRSGSDYPSLFRGLLEEATAGVQGDLVVLVDPADVELGRDTLSGLGLSGEVKGDISTAGGVVVVTAGGRISRRNTLEDRLGKVRKAAQAQVAEILFS